ncbi:flagellar hook-length control protein FliK [Sphingobium boeckii]|uniref:Flagellar hook-length control protein-like C-terminal domain-containing protein n=1 Tax=Sphingobium boeckii TaxID=1082345 RepID=A0A7W9AGH0_9SPHN|nr:flagellar hook-length control protein FliK [Sphingobium boeckii]MBB5685268.1 hypothetical protein [Sphingobium boeckii]
MNIANIAGAVTPLSFAGASPEASSGFGALLAIGAPSLSEPTGPQFSATAVTTAAIVTVTPVIPASPPTDVLSEDGQNPPVAENVAKPVPDEVTSPDAQGELATVPKADLPHPTPGRTKSELQLTAAKPPVDMPMMVPTGALPLEGQKIALVSVPNNLALPAAPPPEIQNDAPDTDVPVEAASATDTPDLSLSAIAPVAQGVIITKPVDAAPGESKSAIDVTAQAGHALAINGHAPKALPDVPMQIDGAVQAEGASALPSALAGAVTPRSQSFSEIYGAHRPAHAAAEPVIAAQPGRIGREMGVEIARHVAAGRDEITVRLDPPEMGRVDIRLSFDRDGAVRGVIAADSAGALDMLRKETSDLTRALADAGVRSDAQSFRFDSRGRDSGHQTPQRQPGESERSAAALTGDPALDQPVYQALRVSGRVDLMA